MERMRHIVQHFWTHQQYMPEIFQAALDIRDAAKRGRHQLSDGTSPNPTPPKRTKAPGKDPPKFPTFDDKTQKDGTAADKTAAEQRAEAAAKQRVERTTKFDAALEAARAKIPEDVKTAYAAAGVSWEPSAIVKDEDEYLSRLY